MMHARPNRIAMPFAALAVAAGIGAAARGGDLAPARCRVIYALPGTPALDFFVDGEPGVDLPTFSGVGFADPTQYATVPAGDAALRATVTGETDDLVLCTGASFEPASTATFIVLGFFPALQGLPVFETPAVDPSMARVRFLHGGQNEPPVDVALDDGTVVGTDVEFSEGSGVVEVPAGKYDMIVRSTRSKQVVLSDLGKVFEAGSVYTFFIFGSTEEQTLVGMTLLDNSVEPDVDGDGDVDVDDLVRVIIGWGECVAGPGQCPADATDDGSIDVTDLEAVLLNFNP